MKRILFLTVAVLCAPAWSAEFDCVGSACPQLVIQGDEAATLPNGKPSPFRGFADATIRKDPTSGRLWMAYSYPNIKINSGRRPSPSVAVHLAYSDDNGDHWTFQGVLWEPTAERSPDGVDGHTSHEVGNLLPRVVNGKTVWYAARLDYFLPDDGGFRKRPPQSFRVRVMQADTPPQLADAPFASLGSVKSDAAYGIDQRLTDLSSELGHCMLWNEPALYAKGDDLYLALSCMAFQGRKPDMEKNDLVVFATRPDGSPKSWRWRYAGRLAGSSDAKALGGTRLTQIDLATSQDGSLVAIMTPDRWSEELSDFVHDGCVVVGVASIDPPRLARNASGALDLRARITASDAGPHGTAACTYDPASTTGILLGKRQKSNTAGLGGGGGRRGGGGGMTAFIYRTGVRP